MDNSAFLIGVCVFPPAAKNWARTVSYPHYIYEILAHAGLCYQKIALQDLPSQLPGLKLLLTVGEVAPSEEVKGALTTWVEAGGAWLSIAGVAGLPALFGAEVEAPAATSWGGGMGTLGEGYLAPDTTHPILRDIPFPLHYFNGVPVHARGGTPLAAVLDAHQRPTQRAAILENVSGQGRCLLLATDILGSVVRIQQGIGVTRDGVPAADGTAPVADDVLKSGDGGVLDWIFDRQPLPGAPGFIAYLEPIADQWRELVLHSLFYLAQQQQIALPLLWLYPRALPAIGHLSHDTDGNDPRCGRLLLDAVQQAQVKTTWCVILPGYDRELIAEIRAAGCELATHYDALDFPWSEAEFDRQWQELCALFGEDTPVSNKNHYLRWEGDSEFFTWCARRGIQLDQSKGASKTGEAGFNFGTCHPFFPVTFEGETLDVLEMATTTQDLLIFAPEVIANVLLEAALQHHGLFHLLFHPAHIDKPGVAQAFHKAIAAGRERGIEWWTARQINDWERARRAVDWLSHKATEAGTEVRLRAGKSLTEATLLWLSPEAEATHHFWGYPFKATVFDAKAGSETTFTSGEAGS